MVITMNLNAVYELKERLYAAAIAGLNLVQEDFRLKRAVEQIEPLATAAPVFKKIYEKVRQLTEPECNDPSSILLESLTLIQAVLCTQGITQVEGEFLKPEVKQGSLILDAPYSLLSPVKEALEGTGSGRYSLLVETHKNHPEIFSDYRIKYAMIQDLDDSYSEIAEKLRDWIIEQNDTTIIPYLKEGFNPAGKKSMLYRLQIIKILAGKTENDFYIQCLEDASKEIKELLIDALSEEKKNVDLFITLAQTEKGVIRKKVLWSLLNFIHSDTVISYLEESVKKSPKSMIIYLLNITADWASDLVAECLIKQLNRIEQSSSNGILSNEDYIYLQTLLAVASGKTSKKMQQAFRLAAEKQDYFSSLHLKKENGKSVVPGFKINHNSSQMNFQEALTDLLTETILFHEHPEETLYDFTEELYNTYGILFVEAKFAMDLLTKEKEELYEKYGTILTSNYDAEIKKKVSKQIIEVFKYISYERKEGCYKITRLSIIEYNMQSRNLKKEISNRWFEFFLTYAKQNGYTQSTITNNNSKSSVIIKFNTCPEKAFFNSAFCGFSYTGIRGLLASLFAPEDPDHQKSASKIGEFICQLMLENGGSHVDIKFLNYLNYCKYKFFFTNYINHNEKAKRYFLLLTLQEMNLSQEELIKEITFMFQEMNLSQKELINDIELVIKTLQEKRYKNSYMIAKFEHWKEELAAGVRPEDLTENL